RHAEALDIELARIADLRAGPRHAEAVRAMRLEANNLQAAVRWALARGEDELAGSLLRRVMACVTEGVNFPEVRSWIEQLLARTEEGTATFANALGALGYLDMTAGEHEQAADRLGRA